MGDTAASVVREIDYPASQGTGRMVDRIVVDRGTKEDLMTQGTIPEKFHSGELKLSDFEGWTEEIKQQFEENRLNGHVGTKLLFENDALRVWEIRLAPGGRLPPHRHQLDYMWTAVTPGRFLQRTYDGTSWENDYDAGLTFYAEVGEGEYTQHDLENVGNTEMIFTTVEFKNTSANPPLDL